MADPKNQHDALENRRLLPTPGAHGPAELVDSDVQSISRAVLLLVTTTEKITFETANNPPPTGSPANALWRGSEGGYAIDGFITMQYANMSAMDHARGFVSLIRTPTVRSTALATVARGALESLARTWHLLARESNSDFVYRVISLLRSDLRYSELLDEPIRTRDGDPVDPVARREFYSAELERLGLPSPARIELAGMVSAMLDAEMGKSDGRMRYSALSSIAHAHRLGINTFITTGNDGNITGLAAPRPVVMDMVGQLVAATFGTTQSFVAFYGDQTRHVELLETAMQRALRILVPIMNSIGPD
ncbi:hypothetical protein ACWKWP_05925 [Agromyces soli]